MYGIALCGFSWWWLVPIIMMILCFFMMRGRRGPMICGCGSRVVNGQQAEVADSAKDIRDKRYASGQIDKDEYAKKKRTLTESTDSIKK